MTLSRVRVVQLLTLVAEGWSNQEIVRKINLNVDRRREGWESWTKVSKGGLDKLLGTVFGQLGAINRQHAVHLAHQKGYLGLTSRCKTCGAPCVCPDCDHGGATARLDPRPDAVEPS